MKIAIRALVLGMLITGFAADHMLANKTAPTATATMVASNSAAPAPGCPGGKACGMDHF
ncbi:MAG: hypothetical protein WA708_04265 [Acidobacteriaceae bacterium]